MTVDIFVQLVSQIGFPIAVCILCFWYINKLTQQHKEEMDKMSEAITNNTIVMQKIYEKLGSQK